MLAPDIVEVHIEPIWGRLQQGLGQIAGRFIVYDVVDADLLEKRAFVGAARRSCDRVPLDLGDLTDNRADRAGRTQMELSCPHDRPRRRHRGPAGGGIEEGPQGEKLAGGSTEARIRLFCPASTLSQRKSSTGQRRRFHGRKNLAPAERSGLFLSGAFISLECRCGAALLPEACHEGV